jgi:glycosyltransferase involved in cell wall biosynthesis
MTTRDALWISWENHRRTTGICEALGLPLVVLEHDGGRATRYPALAWRTLRALAASRPRVLLVQSPSLVLTLLAVLARPAFGYELIVDAHNEAVEPYIHDNAPIRWLTRRLLRAADVTIVTNDGLAEKVAAVGGTPFVLPDRIPEPPHREHTQLPSGCNLVLISTFESDEPYAAVFEAAAEFRDELTLHVTGRETKLPEEYRASLAGNIVFTGFLPDSEYWALLNSVDASVDLSLMDDCLVCGAYEGVAVDKPVILSDSRATRAPFSRATLYVDNTRAGIATALRRLLDSIEEMRRQAIDRKPAMQAQWTALADGLRARLT